MDSAKKAAAQRQRPSLPRYPAKPCDEYIVPLEPCPTCGYALALADQRCRHCAGSLRAMSPLSKFDARRLPQLLGVLLALSLIIYVVFFR